MDVKCVQSGDFEPQNIFKKTRVRIRREYKSVSVWNLIIFLNFNPMWTKVETHFNTFGGASKSLHLRVCSQISCYLLDVHVPLLCKE